MPRTWQFYRHMPVYLAGGRRLGITQEVGHAVDYLHVRQGRLLISDWYIPFEAIADVDGGGVRLLVDMSDLRHRKWNVPPAAYLMRQGATPGYEYTSRTDIPTFADSAASQQGKG